MKKLEVHKLRNIGIVAHGGAGKTSLAEAMLFNAKMTDRMGRVDNGSSTMDYEPEEIKRKITISSSLHHFDWEKHNVNIIDTPGDTNFSNDAKNSLYVADGAVVVIDAISGIKVQTERLWQYCDDFRLPRIIFINKMDRERASYSNLLDDINKILGKKAVITHIPIGAEESFRGLVDLMKMKALVYENDGSGKYTEEEIPEELSEEALNLRGKMIEDIAETSDKLLEKYLEGEGLSYEDIYQGLKEGTLDMKFVPVICGSALKNIGIQPLMDEIVHCLPSPLEKGDHKGKNFLTKAEDVRKPNEDEPFSALVFKTIADPYTGKLTLFRIYSGTLNSDSTAYNSSRKVKERIGQIFRIEGKSQKPIDSAGVGEIVAVAKLKDTSTGNSLCDENAPIIFEGVTPPPPIISFAIEPKTKGDEEKATISLNKLTEEDPTIRIHRDEHTKEIILSGMGQVHLEVILEKLKRKFGVEVGLKSPKVPYKETIRGKAKVQGKYKKQSGGRGQYGDAWLEVEPMPRGAGFEFADKIAGGVIPRQYIPAVEKGIIETMNEGVLAGCPVVDVKASLVFGSFHTVDSSEMAFKIAGSMAFKKATLEAGPVLLEPIMSMNIIVPDENMGDIIGDLNSRRGKVLGVEGAANSQIIRAHVPMAEVLTYAPDLSSMTGDRGTFTIEFSHYEEAPAHISEKVVTAAKKQ
ncbi:MAG: elongation factor G [Deltaproteobacteria bacterium CG12_big_fil_rev_8_21_14_0_65_43_10]|nr:MAG: translation elongation factor G [Deltaproteobacteria bacterium CG2_30_43_15]PIQ45388.1 MAG: elongation factor G [Deltaproteobacteria bacterium CG12_big_fil_rev_8_21_14_0_65_43_10]PIU86579.1 MAG: elongation factor G [Deltaproteobacteria bacterium CG06_land_8_20_14_3_00_44_19]PIX25703.1 MAG: elongation factor G [Deltaproteobacteria bacterium CG_4_8_14_3_um_filter_43_13]PIZ19503.1 MAG: elongation factor G [Deltaproteobacteria bacterium CG_4_10_14_0_8_um_filter_43_12]PJB40528.1 MAG: elonga